jgi:hypothetical protein
MAQGWGMGKAEQLHALNRQPANTHSLSTPQFKTILYPCIQHNIKQRNKYFGDSNSGFKYGRATGRLAPSSTAW